MLWKRQFFITYQDEIQNFLKEKKKKENNRRKVGTTN